MEIVRTRRFEKDIKRIGATAADVAKLQQAIVTNPKVGDVIPGLSGIRKVRFAFGGQGKSGGGRAIYVLVVAKDVAFLLLAYTKNEQSDLSTDQRKLVLAIAKEITA